MSADAAPLVAGLNNGGIYVFWAGTDRSLHELHRGKYNNWRWEEATHDVPALEVAQSLAMACNDVTKSVFWMGTDGKVQELYANPQNGWLWKLLVHEETPPPSQAGLSLAAAVDSQSASIGVFWVGERDVLHELHQGHHNGWRWEHTAHRLTQARVRMGQPLAARFEERGQKRVFWVDDVQNLWQLHHVAGGFWSEERLFAAWLRTSEPVKYLGDEVCDLD